MPIFLLSVGLAELPTIQSLRKMKTLSLKKLQLHNRLCQQERGNWKILLKVAFVSVNNGPLCFATNSLLFT